MKTTFSVLMCVVILFTSIDSSNLFIIAQVDDSTIQNNSTNLTLGPAGPIGPAGPMAETGTPGTSGTNRTSGTNG